MKACGKLYLLPVPISDNALRDYLPEHNLTVVNNLRKFIAEDLKTARRFLKSCGYADISKAEISTLNEHTKESEREALLKNLLNGEDVGLMSDAGCPGIADPGAEVVALAHRRGIRVVPFAGPSSIVLSIMASGFNGQNFAFVGYLPVDRVQRAKRVRELETRAAKEGQAQFFIETPYRNTQMFSDLLALLSGSTLLFIGSEITAPGERLLARRVEEWKRLPPPALHKVPAVFGIFK
jgi:16S rRNA (cytidine1402-2'-O)-methyltransferase